MKKGIADLPLHGGKAPRWLFTRMKALAGEIMVVICREHGPDEFLKRISDPYWFQAFGCLLGFDWHSSGLTTTVCGALKAAASATGKYTGIYICGGKGLASRKTPDEIEALCDKRKVDADGKALIYASRMSAKVDNSALQDGYQLYQHSFFVTSKGKWAVVQQGMNTENRYARRYHWLGDKVINMVCEPQNAVCCDHTSNNVLDMTAKNSAASRRTSSFIARQSPVRTIREYEKIVRLGLPARHFLRKKDILPRNFRKVLQKTYESMPGNFEELLSIRGAGPASVRALALMSEIIYGERASFRDPARYSFAHGGKDGYPYPVNREHYDMSIRFLKNCLSRSKAAGNEKMKAFKRLSQIT